MRERDLRFWVPRIPNSRLFQTRHPDNYLKGFRMLTHPTGAQARGLTAARLRSPQ
ncbi:hypothetical protein EPIB1_571 [Tritonibacter mobilis]|nr:hypothetical protein EPIB1_571 [Tritonibacter mobilis]